MPNRVQTVSLNGVSLTSLSPLILLQHIDERAPEWDVKTADRVGAPGAFVTQMRPTKREVQITFAVRERLNFENRAGVVSAVMAWMQSGGYLTLSSRPGYRLAVVPTEMPNVGKLRDWTQDITFTLTAFAWPYWEQVTPTEISLSGNNSYTGEITVGGNAETAIEADIKGTSGMLTTVTLTVGGQTMSLADLTVAKNSTMKIWRDERHLLRITNGANTLLSKRTGDDLNFAPGTYEYSIATNATSTVKLWARGCVL